MAPQTKPAQQDSQSLGQEIDDLSAEIEGLRAAYEQYFLGVERRPPQQRHDKLKKRVVAIQTSTVKQTAVKFKAQSLNQKLLTYERLWSRTLKEIEDGTYRRDVFKAKLHRGEQEEVKPPPPPKEEVAKGLPPPPPKDALLPGVKPVAGALAAKAAAPVARAPVAAGGGAELSDAKLKAIYDAYVTAKKRCNEDTSKLSFDSVAKTLRQQVPTLMKQHNAKSVEFKVVIKDGKAVLRALPKE
ncbi:MAG: hypothetical protein IPJ65_02905 [Archangiaceae bacterium]|nr:hypothetical protein [Archangiaceae bacterium]